LSSSSGSRFCHVRADVGMTIRNSPQSRKQTACGQRTFSGSSRFGLLVAVHAAIYNDPNGGMEGKNGERLSSLRPPARRPVSSYARNTITDARTGHHRAFNGFPFFLFFFLSFSFYRPLSFFKQVLLLLLLSLLPLLFSVDMLTMKKDVAFEGVYDHPSVPKTRRSTIKAVLVRPRLA
jgi:hypothetical protein